MSVEPKNLRPGLRYRYDNLARGKRIKSPCIFLTAKDVELAESQAVAHLLVAFKRIPDLAMMVSS